MGAPLASWKQKNVDLCMVAEVFSFEVMHPFIMSDVIGVFGEKAS